MINHDSLEERKKFYVKTLFDPVSSGALNLYSYIAGGKKFHCLWYYQLSNIKSDVRPKTALEAVRGRSIERTPIGGESIANYQIDGGKGIGEKKKKHK